MSLYPTRSLCDFLRRRLRQWRRSSSRSRMAGDCPGKTKLEDVDVYIHEPNDNDGTTTVHIDVEHPVLAQIVENDESTFVGGKDAGVFIGLKNKQAERAEEMAANLRIGNEPTTNTDDSDDSNDD